MMVDNRQSHKPSTINDKPFDMRTIVYKVGGSLFDLPGLPRRIAAVLSQRPETRPLLIAGGGAAADVVRQWDAVHALGEERAHWLALFSMMLGERLLAALLRDSQIVATRVLQQLLHDLLGWLPKLGMIRETCQLLKTWLARTGAA